MFSYGTLSGEIQASTVNWLRTDMAAVLGPGRTSIGGSGATLVLEAAGERIEFTRVR